MIHVVLHKKEAGIQPPHPFICHLYGWISIFYISPVLSWPSVRVDFHFLYFTRTFMAVCTGGFPIFYISPVLSWPSVRVDFHFLIFHTYFRGRLYGWISIFYISPVLSWPSVRVDFHFLYFTRIFTFQKGKISIFRDLSLTYNWLIFSSSRCIL